jgi:hypothetical protein
MLAKSVTDTSVRTYQDDYITVYMRDYWDHTTGDLNTPHACLVDHPTPGGTIRAHFHDVDQFQIFTDGTGRIGKHRVQPGSVHYTDQCTTYGPIVNDNSGLKYMTLRPARDSGAKFMPGSKALLTKRPGRTRYYQIDMTQLQSGASTRQLSEETDGVSVCELKSAAREILPGLPVGLEFSRGFYTVLNGSVILEGRALPRESCIYVDAGKPLEGALAGNDGAIVVFASFSHSCQVH